MLSEKLTLVFFRASKAFGIIIVFAFAYALFSTEALKGINFKTVFAAGLVASLLIIISLLLNGLRHAILISQPPAPWWPAFKSLVLSTGLNLVVPGRIAEIVKILYLKKHINLRVANGVAALTLERLMDVFILGIITVYALLTNLFAFELHYPFGDKSIAMLATAFILVSLILAYGTKKRAYIRSFFAQVHHELIAVISSRRLFSSLSLTVAIWALQLIACIMFFQLQTIVQVSIVSSIITFIAINIAVALPGPPAGVGLFQAGVAAALIPTGISWENTLILGISLQISFWWFSILMAIGIMLKEEIGIKSILDQSLNLLDKQG
jgi:hypothetical protein